jgi:hypothetical protein
MFNLRKMLVTGFFSLLASVAFAQNNCSAHRVRIQFYDNFFVLCNNEENNELYINYSLLHEQTFKCFADFLPQNEYETFFVDKELSDEKFYDYCTTYKSISRIVKEETTFLTEFSSNYLDCHYRPDDNILNDNVPYELLIEAKNNFENLFKLITNN